MEGNHTEQTTPEPTNKRSEDEINKKCPNVRKYVKNDPIIEEEEGDLSSSTPLKFIKTETGKKVATATEDESEERKRKLFNNTNEAKITFFGFEVNELKRFIEAKGVDFNVTEEGGNFVKCVCRCNDAFPTLKSFLKLDGAVCDENKQIIGVIMDEENVLPKTPRINPNVFDNSYYPDDFHINRGRGRDDEFGWFGLSWIFSAVSRLFS